MACNIGGACAPVGNKEIKNLKSFSTAAERFEGAHVLCPGCAHSIIVREILNATPELSSLKQSIAEGDDKNRLVGKVKVLKTGDSEITGYALANTTKFKIDDKGNIRTKEALDYETAKVHKFNVFAKNSLASFEAYSLKLRI